MAGYTCSSGFSDPGGQSAKAGTVLFLLLSDLWLLTTLLTSNEGVFLRPKVLLLSDTNWVSYNSVPTANFLESSPDPTSEGLSANQLIVVSESPDSHLYSDQLL